MLNCLQPVFICCKKAIFAHALELYQSIFARLYSKSKQDALCRNVFWIVLICSSASVTSGDCLKLGVYIATSMTVLPDWTPKSLGKTFAFMVFFEILWKKEVLFGLIVTLPWKYFYYAPQNWLILVIIFDSRNWWIFGSSLSWKTLTKSYIFVSSFLDQSLLEKLCSIPLSRVKKRKQLPLPLCLAAKLTKNITECSLSHKMPHYFFSPKQRGCPKTLPTKWRFLKDSTLWEKLEVLLNLRRKTIQFLICPMEHPRFQKNSNR